jgi:hypothetical protein
MYAFSQCSDQSLPMSKREGCGCFAAEAVDDPRHKIIRLTVIILDGQASEFKE